MEATHGAAGAWLRRFKTDEFGLLNWTWLGGLPDRAEALRRFHAEGVARLAPIAFDAVFEPDYYREVHPEYAELDDEALYRRWLFVDLEQDWPGSAEEHLRRMGLDLDAFPQAFDWRGYAGAEDLIENRWFVLQTLLDRGIPAAGFPATGPDAASFARAMGMAYRGRDDRSAIAAFEHAQRNGDASYTVRHQLADARFRQEHWREALRGFQDAAAHPDAGEVWTYVNGARAAVRIGAYRAALDLLESGRAAVTSDPVGRQAVHKTIEAFFAARSGRIRRLYARPEGRARADRRIAALLESVETAWDRLDPIGAPLPVPPDGPVLILASFDIAACAHYRVEQKVEMLRALGREVSVYPPEAWEEFISALPGAAAAVIFRLPAWPTVIRAIRTATRMGTPTFYDVDDLIFDAAEFPDPLEAYGGLLSPSDYEAILFGTPLFRKALSLCDYGLAPTTALAGSMQPLVRTGQVFVVPNGLDSRNEPSLALPARRQLGEDVRIIYASGTKAHNADWDTLAGPAVLAVMEAHPQVRLTVAGHLSLSPEFDRVAERVTRLPHIGDMARFWEVLAGADINLAVLKPTRATDAKSEIKWLEAATLGVPSVVSPTATYREVVEDGRDALIGADPESWRAALERLVRDPGLRASLGEAARRKAVARYALSVNAEKLAEALRAGPAHASGRDTPCILLANVWFPPQSIGGAARVVRDDLDAWLDAGLDSEFRFAVVAADDAGAPYKVRVEDYRGVPVIRIATPKRPGMDWEFENPDVRRVFADLLEFLKPDLVHLHAVQRLTASLADACQTAGTPYLVTPHDAWWLSDWHFLVDEAGRVREPGEVARIDPPPGVSSSQSRDRLRRLRRTLDGAAAILGVSQAFGELHRRCGIDRVIDIPNGVSQMAAGARLPSASGRVRLAHVGNVTRHKGFHLLEAALKQGRFERLELTVVDHGRAPGSETVRTWGVTPVRIVGRRPPEEMAALYAATDVLLAPSIWPESYGLVTREALHAGCWVVAGDRGAIADDVEPGRTGLVIDVSDPGGLFAALETINADPQRFLRSPPPSAGLRTAADQAREVMALYQRILNGAAPQFG